MRNQLTRLANVPDLANVLLGGLARNDLELPNAAFGRRLMPVRSPDTKLNPFR